MFSTSYFIYGKGEGKEGCLRGKDFLFMIVSIFPVSLIRSKIHEVAQIFLFQNGNLILV